MKTTIVAPDAALAQEAWGCSLRFREGSWGLEPRKHHRDAVFLYPAGIPIGGGAFRWPYRIDVWGDPAGRVTVHAHRAPPGGTV